MKHKAFSRSSGGARFTIRQWRIGRRTGLHLLGFLVAVALLAYLGPFGTWDGLGVSDRLAFWAIAVGVNWICANIVFAVTMRTFFAREWPAWAGVVFASLVTAMPGTGAVWGVVAVYMDYRPSGVSEVLRLYAQVAVLQLVIGFLVFYLIERSLRQREATVESSSAGGGPGSTMSGGYAPGVADADPLPGEADAATPAAALLARLPAPKRGELHHLRMQDHYVEVHTDNGMEMVLLRFRDALREVEDIEGMQVHRSHWVARAAVDAVERRDGRITLRLANGNRVPVSRSFVPALRARGWI